MAKYNLGLYWDDLDIQACLVRGAVGEAVIEKIVRRHRPQEAGKPKLPVAEDLKTVMDELGIQAEAGITALNEHEVMYRQIKRPFSDRRKISQTIVPEVETLLPISEDISVDFVMLGKDPAGQTVLEAAAVKSTAVQARMNVLGQIGIEPEIIEAPSSALANGARNFFLLGPERGYVVLHIGWLNSSLCILHGREIAHMGALPFGFEAIAADIARERGLTTADVVAQALSSGVKAAGNLDHVIREVSIALHRLPAEVDGYVLIPAGYAGYLTDISECFAETGIADELPALKGLEYGGPTRDVLLSFMATSLALRGIDTADVLNFRQGEQAFTKQIEKFKGMLGFWGKMFLVLLLIWVVGFGVDIFLKVQNRNKLDAAIKKEFTRVMPPATPMVAPVEQMQQRWQTLQRMFGASGGGDSPLDIIRDISAIIPRDTEARLETFTLDENGITISGSTDSYDHVERIRSGLAGLKNISDVKIVSANVNQSDQRVLFKITCRAGAS